jgi:Toprim-like
VLSRSRYLLSQVTSVWQARRATSQLRLDRADMNEPQRGRGCGAFSEAALSYFAERAIAPGLATTVGVRERDGKLFFPNTAADGSSYYRERSLNGSGPVKVKQPAGQPLKLWWPLGRPQNDSALVCEGESDLLAALEPLSDCAYAEIEAAAIPGTGFPLKRLAEQLAEAGIATAFLALDGDEAGRSYAERAVAALEELGIVALPLGLEAGTDLADNLVRAKDRARWLNNALAGAEAADSWRQAEDTEWSSATRASVASDASVAHWPEPLDDHAFHGLGGEVVRTIEPHSEADPAALLVSTLVMFGNAAGRGAGFQVEGDFHATNLFAAIVGETSKGRKGTSELLESRRLAHHEEKQTGGRPAERWCAT